MASAPPSAALAGLSLQPAPPPFPRSRSASLQLCGMKTELLVCRYSGTLFLVATQLPTLGMLLHVRTVGAPVEGGDASAGQPYASSDDEAGGGAREAGAGFDISVLLGRREDGSLEAALARALAARLAPSQPPPALLLGVGLARPRDEPAAAAQREEARAVLLPALVELAQRVLEAE